MDARISRRGLLGLGGVAAGAALVGARAAPASAIAAPTPPFPLNSWVGLLAPTTLAGTSIMQSFAYDNVNDTIYFAQRRKGSAEDSGDLTITRTGLKGGIQHHVHLTAFGHGTQIGVEPSTKGGAVHVWVETESVGGAGNKLARFNMDSFAPGKVLAQTTAGVADYDPVGSGTRKSICIDWAGRKAILRYLAADGSGFHYRRYALSDFVRHEYGVYQDISTPNHQVFQGFTSHGDWLYLLTGEAKPKLNTTVIAIPWALPTLDTTSNFITVASGLEHREPEGMAIRIPDTGVPRLCFGFASGPEGARKASIYATP